jgi:flavin-dependent dehydrogenase
VAAIKSAIPTRRFDAVIVGAGGSGMRASLQLAEAGLNVAVLSKGSNAFSHGCSARWYRCFSEGICLRITGSGTCSILSRAVIISAIRCN